jgi:molybdopterin-guanine dinucleotide biosynthesis protein A
MIVISGIILAGGQGRRMVNANTIKSNTNRVEKGLVNFLNKPLVTHVAARLAPQVNEIIISANNETERYAALGYPVIQDEISGFAGPLAGLHAGMKTAKNPYVLTVPCDSPLLPADLAERFSAALINSGAEIAVAKTATQIHPVFCLCSTRLRPHLEHYLDQGGRKFEAWFASLDGIAVAFDDNPQAFANINTPQDLIRLETLACAY